METRKGDSPEGGPGGGAAADTGETEGLRKWPHSPSCVSTSCPGREGLGVGGAEKTARFPTSANKRVLEGKVKGAGQRRLQRHCPRASGGPCKPLEPLFLHLRNGSDSGPSCFTGSWQESMGKGRTQGCVLAIRARAGGQRHHGRRHLLGHLHVNPTQPFTSWRGHFPSPHLSFLTH